MPKHADDLTGRKVGDWLVMERVSAPGQRVSYRCRCACGDDVVVSGSNLRLGRSQRCRKCAAARMAEALAKEQEAEWIGRRAGEWLVLGPAGKCSNNRQRLWWCRCSCGAVRKVRAFSLKAGTSTRCQDCARSRT